MTTDFRMRFTYLNGYRERKSVTTFVEAQSAAEAETIARQRISDLYGIDRARLDESEAGS